MPAEEDATGCLCRECLVRELRFQGLEVADCDAKDPDDTGCGKSGGLGDSDKVAGLKSGHADEHVGQSVRCTDSTR